MERGENEPGGDDDHALGPASDADLPAQTERLGLRARVTDEEGACDGGEHERYAPFASVPHEDEPDRSEHEAFSDAVDRRIEKRPERRAGSSPPCQGPVENVEDRARDKQRGAGQKEPLGAVLEVDDRGAGDAKSHPGNT